MTPATSWNRSSRSRRTAPTASSGSTSTRLSATSGGSWFQRDSNLHFSDVRESFVEGGLFYPGLEVEGDTNAIREITSTSFLRKEWTPLRQKPFWITYRKKSINTLDNGTFRFTREYVVDDSTSSTVQINISLEGKGFAYDYVESSSGDTLDAFQAQATWYQIGSIFATEQNLGRSFDTSSACLQLRYWDTIPGTLMQRIKEVSDTAFQMWSPASFFTEGQLGRVPEGLSPASGTIRATASAPLAARCIPPRRRPIIGTCIDCPASRRPASPSAAALSAALLAALLPPSWPPAPRLR